MLDRTQITHAVEMQQRSYRLLKWMAAAVKDKQYRFEEMHDTSSFPEAAAKWIEKNEFNIPLETRVSRENIPSFAAFFTTYLTNSFELVANPGKQLYSPDAHCFCHMCSWLIESPNLKTKKVKPSDKSYAENLKAKTLLRIALENKIAMTETDAENLLSTDQIDEDAAIVAYGYDLLQRLNGIANGAVVLALWRTFAWTKQGSPKPNFKLTPDLILQAEQRLITDLTSQR